LVFKSPIWKAIKRHRLVQNQTVGVVRRRVIL
jgi:hypothetical protein